MSAGDSEQLEREQRELEESTGSVTIELPASIRYLNVVSGVLRSLVERLPNSPPVEAIDELELALQEACVNSIRHAMGGDYAQRLVLSVAFTESSIVVSIDDTGEAFDADAVTAPDLDVPQVHGYGLFLIEQLVDEVNYERVGDINRWTLSKRWESKDS